MAGYINQTSGEPRLSVCEHENILQFNYGKKKL